MQVVGERQGPARREAGRRARRDGRDLRRLRWVKLTVSPHAADRMEEFGISVADAYRVLSEPEEEGRANLGRLYAQRNIGNRRIRVVYNRGAGDERIVVTAMLRRK